ncbi:hypothetical protein M0R45_009800 [Rubus argutus]|uniref:Uncharacterized protein n=1 Tax=Rubus argutus TaxID=59490 RepID=A0AAW1Y909_RUBAR
MGMKLVAYQIELYRHDKVSYIQNSGNKTCYVTLKPSFVYYQLDNFYQNHLRCALGSLSDYCSVHHSYCFCVFTLLLFDRGFQHFGYVKSRSDQQLQDPKYENEVDACKPEEKTNGKPVVPCDLIAWSLFNDTSKFFRDEQQLAVNKRGIAWKSDRENNFGKNVFPENFQNSTLKGGASLNASIQLNEQEDLIVWMRTAALPTF